MVLLALSTLNTQLATTSLRAATLTVTSLADSGAGSLRDQVAASSTGDTIRFAVSGTILLSSAISISHSLNVQGPGPSALVVDANHLDRAFVISASSTNAISGMTITNGLNVGAPGADGGVGQNGTAGGDASGGAIYNQGNYLLLSNCWLVGSTVEGGRGGRGGTNVIGEFYFNPGNGGAGGTAAGGAVYSQSSLEVIRCTFSSNRAVGGAGGQGGTNIASSLDPGGAGSQGGNAFGGPWQPARLISPAPLFPGTVPAEDKAARVVTTPTVGRAARAAPAATEPAGPSRPGPIRAVLVPAPSFQTPHSPAPEVWAGTVCRREPMARPVPEARAELMAI